jgi:hypothetical protein
MIKSVLEFLGNLWLYASISSVLWALGYILKEALNERRKQ